MDRRLTYSRISTSLSVPLKQQGMPAMVRAAAPIRHLLIHSQLQGMWVMYVGLPALLLITATGQITCNSLPESKEEQA